VQSADYSGTLYPV